MIREINPKSDIEITLVATRMRQTLIDVLGLEKGASMYSMEWLVQRVRWHLDPQQTMAKIFLSENHQGTITGQAIARIESDATGEKYGYFSTIFVDSDFRGQGIATQLLLSVENWFREMQMAKIIYNTATNNSKLLQLFYKHGYQVTLEEAEMVQLTKKLNSK